LIKIGQFGEFYKKKLSPHLNFDWDWTMTMGTSHEELHAFLVVQVNGCEISI
jgi:hypothetical protein